MFRSYKCSPEVSFLKHVKEWKKHFDTYRPNSNKEKYEREFQEWVRENVPEEYKEHQGKRLNEWVELASYLLKPKRPNENNACLHIPLIPGNNNNTNKNNNSRNYIPPIPTNENFIDGIKKSNK